MERTAVSSTNVSEIGYDRKAKTLEVAFSNGSVYQYFKVPAKVHNELMAAKSIGKFLATRIKGFFRCERVDG